ncbi:RNA polymerase sigma factor [Abyssibacter sp.]|jgi:RNA polymerase sigma-70 factor (ECF subfamily)|uniref:RNA polymerase sigma factor n=1 Tax=Abyssibacter sp. TaxID=2320200 RepID=UPI0025BF0F43|nr:RNA polymerase sigma factor [Abyssibacter sp.]MCK5858527.1 RNA polymerase sigma factor [Abyssibacter sp.]
MNPRTAAGLSARIDAIYRTESRRILATLIRLLGDFDQAEEAMHEAFAAAVEQWASDGIPDNPRAWLVSTGRFKFIDKLRRRTRFDTLTPELVRLQDDARSNDPAASELDGLEDDRLRLIFTCCHPALSTDAQVALTLREICDLTTEEIARSYLAAPSTLAQRIVRAKAKIKRARIPYEVPSPAELPDRLEAVLRVVYLVFNEGYAASSGDTLTRQDLSGEAIRLGRLLAELLPDPDVLGLLALMLFHEARRAARTDDTGELVRLEDQDRKLWDNATIAEANTLLDRAFAGQRIGAYTLQAAIIGVHANTATAADTDWNQIIALYDLLLRLQPSPIVQLNRAAAVSMRDGPQAGLALLDALATDEALATFHPYHAARAELLRQLGDPAAADHAYVQALHYVSQTVERRFLEKRRESLQLAGTKPLRPG